MRQPILQPRGAARQSLAGSAFPGRAWERGQADALNLRIMRTRPTTADDRLVRRLAAFARLAALGQHARRTARMPTALAAAFAAAHRMIDRVLRGAAIVRLAALPAIAACLAQADVHVVRVADDAKGRAAI